MAYQIQHWLVVFLIALASYVMLADYFNLRDSLAEKSSDSSAAIVLPQPWGGYALRERVMSAGAEWIREPRQTDELIGRAARTYPLDAQQWLDLARINASTAAHDQVDLALEKALAVRPRHRSTLWQAAQIALQTNDERLAERQLKQWLEYYPGDTDRALFIGKRWISEPGELLDRMLPRDRDYLEQAMNVALRQNDAMLADEVWKRLEPKPGLHDSVFLQYVELLLQERNIERAIRLWVDRETDWEPGMLFNGSFSRDVGPDLGLNWHTARAPAGVQIERDSNRPYSPPASLRIAFNGKENINLRAPWIRIPVVPGARYRLSGMWRAEALTTRALPYLQLIAEGGGLSHTETLPGTKFDWQPWSFEFSVPDETHIMRFSVRRDPTQAFDRNIGGTLWLDEFRISRLDSEDPATSTKTVADAKAI